MSTTRTPAPPRTGPAAAAPATAISARPSTARMSMSSSSPRPTTGTPFRPCWDYAGGFLTDWGTHRFDSVHQVMGADAPVTVTAVGNRYELKDGGETPDVLQVTYEYPGFVLSYESCQLNAHGVGGRTPGK